MPSCLAAVASWQLRPAACVLHSMACAMSCARKIVAGSITVGSIVFGSIVFRMTSS